MTRPAKHPEGRVCPSCDTRFPESEYGFDTKRWAPYKTCQRCRAYSKNYFRARKLARAVGPLPGTAPIDQWLRMPLN